MLQSAPRQSPHRHCPPIQPPLVKLFDSALNRHPLTLSLSLSFHKMNALLLMQYILPSLVVVVSVEDIDSGESHSARGSTNCRHCDDHQHSNPNQYSHDSIRRVMHHPMQWEEDWIIGSI